VRPPGRCTRVYDSGPKIWCGEVAGVACAIRHFLLCLLLDCKDHCGADRCHEDHQDRKCNHGSSRMRLACHVDFQGGWHPERNHFVRVRDVDCLESGHMGSRGFSFGSNPASLKWMSLPSFGTSSPGLWISYEENTGEVQPTQRFTGILEPAATGPR
jgi:hypothetical protein